MSVLVKVIDWYHELFSSGFRMKFVTFLLVPIVPLVPMDHWFDESYPFVYIGHV